MREATIQEVIIGEVLADFLRRPMRRLHGKEDPRTRLLGSIDTRRLRALSGNARRQPQAVIKRVRGGGARNARQLKRQLMYVTRDEGVKVSWMNLTGIEKELREGTVDRVVDEWSTAWKGSPKWGHTEHIVMSFPRGTSVELAERIAREWGQVVFGSGEFGDSWRYIAAVHQDTDHVHAHFVVDKVGIEWGQFLSINYRADLNYDVMRELQARIARKHGLDMVASSRLSRGLIENAPRDQDYRAAHARGKIPEPRPLPDAEKLRREALVRGFAVQYENLARLAGMFAPADEAGEGGTFPDRTPAQDVASIFSTCASLLKKGVPLMPDDNVARNIADPTERLAAAKAQLLKASHEAWEAIQEMEPSVEKVMLEAEFAKEAREIVEGLGEDPFFSEHAEIMPAEHDPFHNPVTASINNIRRKPHLDTDGRVGEGFDKVMEDLRRRLNAAFSVEEDKIELLGTSADELTQLVLQGDHSKAQIREWHEKFDQAGLDPEDIEDLTYKASRVVDDYELPGDLQEMIARDQIMTAERYHSLRDVPAIEMLVEKVKNELSSDQIQAIQAGDPEALREHIQDPIIRSAVASELRNEGNLEMGDRPDHSKELDTPELQKAIHREIDVEVERLKRAGYDKARLSEESLDIQQTAEERVLLQKYQDMLRKQEAQLKQEHGRERERTRDPVLEQDHDLDL